MDWNWFFSSVAQSIAALVGVLGAFLVSRLLNNETSFSRNQARTRQLLRDGEELTDYAKSRYFSWYNERVTERELAKLKRELEDAESPRAPEDYYRELNFSPYTPKDVAIRNIEITIRSFFRARENPLRYSPVLTIDPTLVVGSQLSDEREEIDQLVVRVKSHIRAAQEHYDVVQSQPERSKSIQVVLAAMLVLFMVGVVLPLSYLPVASSSEPQLSVRQLVDTSEPVRTLILAIAVGVVVALVVALILRTRGLKHGSEDLGALEERLDPASYSQYLAIRVQNGIPL